MKAILDTRSHLTDNLWKWDRQDHSSQALRRYLRVMNSESLLNCRYRGRTVEFFIGIFDSDKAWISRKRCTTRTRYILHSRARGRSRFCDPLVNLRSLFIEIYLPKHSARRRHRSRYWEYQSGIFTSLSSLPRYLCLHRGHKLRVRVLQSEFRDNQWNTERTEFLRCGSSFHWAFSWLITVNRVKYLWFIGMILQRRKILYFYQKNWCFVYWIKLSSVCPFLT